MSKRINGEGTIYKRKDGRWCGAYYDQMEPPRRHYVYGKSQKEVSIKLKQMQELGALENRKEFLFKDWIMEYMQNYKRNELKESTYGTYMMLYRKHIEKSDLGQILLSKIKASDLQKFYNGKISDGYSSKTVRHMEVIINSSLKQAVMERRILENPNDYTVLPKRKQYQGNVLNAEEVRTLVEKSKDDDLYPIVITAIFTGMRRGELMGLTWDKSIDLLEQRIHVTQSMCRIMEEPDENGVTRARYELLEPKTEKSIRYIPMLPIVKEALEIQKDRQEKNKKKYGELYYESNLVFTETDGNCIKPRNLMEKFHKYLKKYGVTDCRFHDLRHCFASLLLVSGVGMKVTSELLGHSTISTSMNIYTHVYEETKSNALNKLFDVIEGKNE